MRSARQYIATIIFADGQLDVRRSDVLAGRDFRGARAFIFLNCVRRLRRRHRAMQLRQLFHGLASLTPPTDTMLYFHTPLAQTVMIGEPARARRGGPGHRARCLSRPPPTAGVGRGRRERGERGGGERSGESSALCGMPLWANQAGYGRLLGVRLVASRL